ncbi:MAG: hypothetical protein HC857_08500 [Synechococcales cyanobacterium RU_4_20]|nr:hypothetical protein [Synechococcales cyanobacterium RU_4_20]
MAKRSRTQWQTPPPVAIEICTAIRAIAIQNAHDPTPAGRTRLGGGTPLRSPLPLPDRASVFWVVGAANLWPAVQPAQKSVLKCILKCILKLASRRPLQRVPRPVPQDNSRARSEC